MPSSSEGLLSLSRRLWATCEVELKEPLHLGAGKDPTSPVDLIIIRDSKGNPIIPGSSLKGVIRSHLARLLLGVRATGQSSVKVGSIEIPLEPCIDSVAEGRRDHSSLDDLCLLDKIFGFAGTKISLSSRVRFTDARPVVDPETMVRTHVSIDRIRDAAKRGMLVNVEAVRESIQGKSTKFSFDMIFDEVSDPRFKESNAIFYLLLSMLDRGVEEFIGGWKSRGYGLSVIRLSKLRVADVQELIQGKEREVTLGDLLGEAIS